MAVRWFILRLRKLLKAFSPPSLLYGVQGQLIINRIFIMVMILGLACVVVGTVISDKVVLPLTTGGRVFD
mgnify:CR=1 FL=1